MTDFYRPADTLQGRIRDSAPWRWFVQGASRLFAIVWEYGFHLRRKIAAFGYLRRHGRAACGAALRTRSIVLESENPAFLAFAREITARIPADVLQQCRDRM